MGVKSQKKIREFWRNIEGILGLNPDKNSGDFREFWRNMREVLGLNPRKILGILGAIMGVINPRKIPGILGKYWGNFGVKTRENSGNFGAIPGARRRENPADFGALNPEEIPRIFGNFTGITGLKSRGYREDNEGSGGTQKTGIWGLNPKKIPGIPGG